jgi:hypothetical protein
MPPAWCYVHGDKLLPITSSKERTPRGDSIKRNHLIGTGRVWNTSWPQFQREGFPELALWGWFVALSNVGIHQMSFRSFSDPKLLILSFPTQIFILGYIFSAILSSTLVQIWQRRSLYTDIEWCLRRQLREQRVAWTSGVLVQGLIFLQKPQFWHWSDSIL